MIGASFAAPPPQHSYDNIVAFNAVASASLDVYSDGHHPELTNAAVIADKEWGAADPVMSGPALWADVLRRWKAPELVVDTAGADSGNGGAIGTAPAQAQSIVEAVIGEWMGMMGWDTGENALKNDVMMVGNEEPLVWREFNRMYMAVPTVSV